MVNAQTWLESQEQYNTKEKRAEVKELDIRYKDLEGELDLKDFTSLEILDCSSNQLTNLRINNCLKLKELQCGFNQLINLDLKVLNQLETINCNDNHLTSFDYSALNPDKLTRLNISANNLPGQDLTVFSDFSNLETLWIGNENEEHRQQNIYNKFSGSLEPLQNLTKLRSLHISNVDIGSGTEYLPSSIRRIYCSSKEKPESQVKKIAEQLNDSNSFFLDNEEKSKYSSTEKVNAQEWLDANYPKEKREKIKKIYIDQCNLKGSLLLERFINLERLNCWDNYLTSLDASFCPKLKILTCSENQLTHLNISNCSKLEGLTNLQINHCKDLKALVCNNNQLENLNLSNSSKLENVYCSKNKLTSLDLVNCSNIIELYCWGNNLTEIDLSSLNSEKLEELSISSNNLTERNLSFLSRFINLKKIWIGTYNKEKVKSGIYNRFVGSLEHLQNMNQLEELDIK